MYFSKYKVKKYIKMTTLFLTLLRTAKELYNIYRNNKKIEKMLKR